MTLSETIELIEKAMEGVTPGRWGQFHPSYAPEAEGAPFSTWDSSHDLSAIKDGKKFGRIATFKHSSDAAYVDACSPDRMREVLAAAREADVLKREIAELHTVLAMVRACYFIGRPDCANEFVRSTWELVHTADDARALLSKAIVNAGEPFFLFGDPPETPGRKFQLGQRVTKTKGSSWNGRVVGFYSTTMTPIGYAVESDREPGSVQIYPEGALAFATETKGSES